MKITLAESLKQKPDFTKLGFGKYFTDHMLYMEYADGKWSEVEIKPFSDIAINPASVVLHYGQEIFEGMKAYKNKEGKITMFRPMDNLLRMNRSAARLCMAQLPVEEVLEGLKKLVLVEKDWIPTEPGTSLYIRPTMIGSENFLGVHPSKKYIFFIILSPVGSYYAHGLEPTKIIVEDIFNRSTAEFVDRLIIVANDADVVGATRQQPHQMELRNARVLVLVNDDIAEAILVVFPRFRVILQQFDGV